MDTRKPGMVSGKMTVARLVAALFLGHLAGDVRSKALKVVATEPESVFTYYMYIWNIFYACYALLPLLK